MGISDVMEITKAIKSNPDVKVEDCRPMKVIAFLKTECKRIIGEMAPNADKATILDLINFVTKEKIDMCIHSKPLFYSLQ